MAQLYTYPKTTESTTYHDMKQFTTSHQRNVFGFLVKANSEILLHFYVDDWALLYELKAVVKKNINLNYL